MRIAFVLNSLRTGGAEIQTVDLSAGLEALGHACLLVALVGEAEIDTRGISSKRVAGSGLGNLAAIRRLGGTLRSWAPDLVVAVNERPLMYVHLATTLAGIKTPIIIVFHTTQLQTPGQRIRHALAEPFFARSDVLVFVSENQRQHWVARGLSAKRLETIRNGIDETRFSPEIATVHRARERAALRFEDRDYVLGLSAAFRPEKNHLQAIEALAILRSQGATAKLLLLGDGPGRSAILAAATARGVTSEVTFAGRQADVVPWLSAVDVGLLTSTTETFSLAALEIMGLGRPVVLSDIGGASEMVVPGVTGYLFAASDTDGLVSALGELADPDRRSPMGVAAADRVRREFTRGRMIADYEHLFRSLLSQQLPAGSPR